MLGKKKTFQTSPASKPTATTGRFLLHAAALDAACSTSDLRKHSQGRLLVSHLESILVLKFAGSHHFLAPDSQKSQKPGVKSQDQQLLPVNCLRPHPQQWERIRPMLQALRACFHALHGKFQRSFQEMRIVLESNGILW